MRKGEKLQVQLVEPSRGLMNIDFKVGMLERLSTIFHRGTIFASMTSSCNGEGKTKEKKKDEEN